MIDTPDELAVALRGTALDGLPVAVHEIRGGHTVLEVDLTGSHDPTNAQANRDLWAAMQPLIQPTGRYPVRASNSGPNIYGGEHHTPRDVLDGIPDVSLEDARSWLRTPQLHWVDDDWGETRAATVERVGAAPTFEDLDALRPRDDRTVERHLLRWETERGWSYDQDPRDAYARSGRFDWSEYEERAWLVWLPTTLPEKAAAFLDYYGGGGSLEAQLRFVRLLRSWGERFGAKVVAWGSVTLDLWVERPPQDLESAFDFAYELASFTRTDMWLRDFARALVGRQEIQLFQRP